MQTLVVVAVAFALVVALALREGRRRGEKIGREAAKLFNRIDDVLRANPTDPEAHAEARRLFNRMDGLAVPLFAGPLYALVLELLQNHPGDSNLRVFALEAGRLALGLGRPGGLPTIYDEQAIQNDISARTGTTPHGR